MRVSIVTVCYNSEKTIRMTIESVLSQRNIDLDYILVDGASQDSTVEIIREYAEKNPLIIRWISEPDKGIYDAMNKGIMMADGDIVGLLNSDDFYIDSTVLKMIEAVFKNNKIDAVFADVRFIRSNNLNKTIRYYSSKNFNPSKFKYGFMPAHPTFFTYKENYVKYGFYKTNYKIAADYELLVRFLYVHCLVYQYIPRAIIKMRMGGNSTRSLKSNYILNKEFVQGCAENGIRTNMFILCLKYFRKIFEFVFTKN
jgi:glycosyltransferase involved in cell wall biosynthesis